MNGYQQEGFGADGHDGARRPALERGARVSRSGAAPPEPPRAHRRARPAACASRAPARSASTTLRRGRTVSVRAGREVILAGGAINSPQLLMLSGIGDADELAGFDIPVVAHLPGVGRNLQDHLEIYVQHACTRPISLYAAQKPWNKLRIGLEWLLLKRGLGATSHFEAGAFIRSRAGVEHPDLQYHFLPIAMNYDGSNPQQTHGFQAHVGPMRPTSVGRVQPALGRPARAAVDPVQLHGHRRRPPGDARRGAPDARDLRPAGVRSLPRPGARARRRGRDRRRDRRLRARPGRERLSPVRHLQDGPGQRPERGGRRRLPGLRRARACASSTPRSCRASPRATSTRRRSCSPRRRPT